MSDPDLSSPSPRRLHPGSGRREAPSRPKGRGVEPEALADVRLAGEGIPLRRDLLIEHLHALQDRFGCLHARHLAALADSLRLAQVEVYEVATFYAHFDVVLDGETAPPRRTVRVCDGVACRLAGAEDLIRDLGTEIGPHVRVVRAPCIGRCDRAPAAFVGRNVREAATAESIRLAVQADAFEAEIPLYPSLERYEAEGGYATLRACLEGRGTRDDLVEMLEASGLRGLGGAGFRSAQKWRIVRDQPEPRLLAVNADEGEPGTFKDRFYLETDPHRFLEGVLLAAWAVEAQGIYIYLRDEYPHILEILRREVPRLELAGLVPAGVVQVRRGAGAYICGEETAMLESLEGKRGYPRQKPPFPTQAGLFGRPTLIHNVETLYWLRSIFENGPGWMADQGRNGRKGLRSFSLSGRVRQPGVKLAPAGITVRELIDEYGGGMLDGHTFKGYLPGGASGGILPAHLGDVPLDFGTLEPYGCFIGSAAVVVLSDRDNVREIAAALMSFFEDESCGQCTPCRVGTEKAVTLMKSPVWDEALLTELSMTMRDASICGLGQAAPNPLLCALRYFPEDAR